MLYSPAACCLSSKPFCCSWHSTVSWSSLACSSQPSPSSLYEGCTERSSSTGPFSLQPKLSIWLNRGEGLGCTWKAFTHAQRVPRAPKKFQKRGKKMMWGMALPTQTDRDTGWAISWQQRWENGGCAVDVGYTVVQSSLLFHFSPWLFSYTVKPAHLLFLRQ